MQSQDRLSIGIAGLGAIGGAVARKLAAGLPGLRLDCVAVRDVAKGEAWLAANRVEAPIVPLAELPRRCDVVVECLPSAHFAEIAGPVIDSGDRKSVV